MFFKVSVKAFKQTSLFLLVFCVLLQVVYSLEVSRIDAIQIENEAKDLSEIWNGDDIRQSIMLYQEAAKSWEKLNDLKRSSYCLRKAAELLLFTSDLDHLQKTLKKSLSLDRKTKNIEGQVISHAIYSQYFERRDEIDQSNYHYERAVLLSRNSTAYAKAYANYVAGTIEYQNIDVERASSYFENAEIAAQEIDDKDLQAKIALGLGLIDATLDNKEKAIAKIKKAKSLWESIENQKGIGRTYNALGFFYVLSDEKQKALKHYGIAESYFKENLDFFEQAKTIAGIGRLYSEFGQESLAIRNLSKSYEIFESLDYASGRLNVCTELSRIYFLKGDIEKSNKFLDIGVKIAEKLGKKAHLTILIEGKALIDMHQNKLDDALAKFKRVDIAYTKAKLKLPRVKHNIGKIYLDKGELNTARKYFQLAYDQNKELDDTVHLAENIHYLAKVSEKLGDIERAVKQSAESLKIAESIYNNIANHNLRKGYHSNTYDRYELHIDLLMKMHKRFQNKGFDIEALKTSEESRSRLMRENLQFTDSDYMLDADPKLVSREKELMKSLTGMKKQLATMLKNSEPIRSDAVSSLKSDISATEDKLEMLIAKLKENSPIYSEIKNSSEFDLESFQQDILDDDTLLLEFFFGKERSYLWVIGKNSVDIAYLPNAESLNSKIGNLLQMILAKEKLRGRGVEEYQELATKNEIAYWEDAAELSKILFSEIEHIISDKRLLVVPDGTLRYFPISALPHPAKDGVTPILLTNEVIHQPTALMLSLLKSRHNRKNQPDKDFLIFSDPVFSLNDERLEERKKYFVNNSDTIDQDDSNDTRDTLNRLSGSKYESDAIFNHFDDGRSTVITSFDASKHTFQNSKLDDYKILHFATHGIFNEKSPNLSGIVLSKYNEEGKQQTDLVWLQDLYRLKLSADLVVLSACDMGIGQNVKGEGLQSLTNGFLQVGAQSVISSHWKVEDNATLDLMDNFYRILAEEDVTTAEALQKAKIKMFENPNYKSPYYWSSFTIHGDFQIKPKLSKKFSYTNYFSLLFLAFVLVTSAFLIKKNYYSKIT